MAITYRRPNKYHRGSVYAHLAAEERPQPRNSRERRARHRLVKEHQGRIRHMVWRARGHGDISRQYRDVGVALADFAGLDGGCFPSHKTLAKAAGCCDRTVRRALHRLEELGIVRWTRRKIAGDDGADHQTSNLYAFPDRVAQRPFVEREAEASPAPVLSSKNLESDSTDSPRGRSKLGAKHLSPELLDRLNPLPNGRRRPRERPPDS